MLVRFIGVKNSIYLPYVQPANEALRLSQAGFMLSEADEAHVRSELGFPEQQMAEGAV